MSTEINIHVSISSNFRKTFRRENAKTSRENEKVVGGLLVMKAAAGLDLKFHAISQTQE